MSNYFKQQEFSLHSNYSNNCQQIPNVSPILQPGSYRHAISLTVRLDIAANEGCMLQPITAFAAYNVLSFAAEPCGYCTSATNNKRLYRD